MLFPSGYAANLSVGMALGSAAHPAAQDSLSHNTRVHIYSDQLNHASIIDGIKYARTKAERSKLFLHIYKHNDMRDLQTKLRKTSGENDLKIVISESVFSMDGDICHLRDIVKLKEKYGFLLVLDEAHATLVFGERGGGLAQHLNCTSSVDIVVGTLSKAIGSMGGFIVVHTPLLRSIILNKGRPVIYSTALPVSMVQTAIRNINVSLSQRGEEMRTTLQRNILYLRRRLIDAGFSQEGKGDKEIYLQVSHPKDLLGVASPILPIRMPSEHCATKASQYLKDHFGIFVPAIRPPTVPVGTSRLRIAVTAAHSVQDLSTLVHALTTYKRLNLDSQPVKSRL